MLKINRFQWRSIVPTASCLVAMTVLAPTAMGQQRNEENDRQQNYQDETDQRDFRQGDRDDLRPDAPPEPTRRGERFQSQSNRDDSGQRVRNQDTGNQAGLGVHVVDTQRGVMVQRVAPDSPADEAGIREGDMIVAIDGNEVRRSNELVQAVRQDEPGAQVRIQIRRDGQQRTVSARLEDRQEALGDDMRRMASRDQTYDRGPAAPWGEDHLLQHINALEQQIKHIQHELSDLRAMLQNNPSGSQSNRTSPRLSDRDRFERDDDREDLDRFSRRNQ